MSMLVGSSTLRQTCNHKGGCNNKSPEVTGSLDQAHYRETDRVAKQAGWYVSSSDDTALCPTHRQ